MSKQALIDALEAFPAGWTIDAARPGVIHGTANIGAIHEGEFYGFITVDTDDYNHPEQAIPIADYIAKANPATIRALLADLERSEKALRKHTKDAEQLALENWLARVCPSGDVEDVHRQWEASSDFDEINREWGDAFDALAQMAGGG